MKCWRMVVSVSVNEGGVGVCMVDGQADSGLY